jgi:hypothetical protein
MNRNPIGLHVKLLVDDGKGLSLRGDGLKNYFVDYSVPRKRNSTYLIGTNIFLKMKI